MMDLYLSSLPSVSGALYIHVHVSCIYETTTGGTYLGTLEGVNHLDLVCAIQIFLDNS